MFLLRCMSPEVALLRRADWLRECLFIGVDRKGLADGQSDANDPKRTPRWFGLGAKIEN
jgi:hypothetical protein